MGAFPAVGESDGLGLIVYWSFGKLWYINGLAYVYSFNPQIFIVQNRCSGICAVECKVQKKKGIMLIARVSFHIPHIHSFGTRSVLLTIAAAQATNVRLRR